ncbi:MAG: beta-ketoacyl-[acyl-carrier-protein] synthase family protein [Planctomycetes bacterium]|nr:beta-ketoacyl-[acyl-carrier-protein] synthase family protein [Planctomycetota bacterium]
MSRRRIVITGMGMVAPLGLTVEDNWQALLAGKSGVSRTRKFEADTFPTTFSGQVPPLDLADYTDRAAEFAHSGDNVRFAVAASRMAYDDSGLTADSIAPERFGVYLGSGEGPADFFAFIRSLAAGLKDGQIDTNAYYHAGLKNYDGMNEWEQEPGRSAAHLARLYNALGPNANTLTACAASTQAMGEAMMVIRRGDADVMITGGTHTMIQPFGVMGFNLLTAIATEPREHPEKASCPFDRKRSGFVMGEGSSILIIEELEHALARGATIHAELIGYGSSADAYRMTDIHPEGRGPVACLEAAVADAGIAKDEIDYVSAHGTSTTENDKVETLSLKKFFGDHAPQVPVSSIKSSMGHLIAAAGATELITCVLAIRDQVLPPTINYEDLDEGLDLDYVPNKARPAKVETCLSESFGFGGQNDALVVRRYRP